MTTSEPIRLLHFADLHVGIERYGHIDPATGLNGRAMDFLRRLSDLVDFAIAKKVDLVIFAGDAYKNRDPNSTYRREFAWRIKELADHGIPVVLIPGNHDLPAVAARASSIEVFATLAVPNVVVLEQFELITLTAARGQAVQVAAAPYPLTSELLSQEEYRGISLEDLDGMVSAKMVESIQALAARAREQAQTPAILVGHFSVSTAELGSERGLMVGRDVTVPRSVLADPTWDYVALGHIHKHQDLNAGAHPPVVYSGSVERVDFGEEKEPKGWVLAEVGRGRTSYQFITQHQRQARRFVTIDCDCRQAADPTDEVLKAIARREVADAIVRVRVELRPDQEAGLKERTIRAALAEAYEVAAISREVEGAVRSRWGAINVEALTPMQQLELFFRSSNVPETQVKGLLADADAIIREVDAALVAAS
ncbi:MAG: exonuclease SbcCD subunit D [Caldilineales bacterium]|nr:exonuclease SbcCD subunit D [Caldilineales bacterium]MCW5859575.1 exonuclease SbcCD subunit D [Caldilineales bacterium]